MFDPVYTHDNGYPQQMASADGRLRIDFVGYAEPNNGRELWRVNVFLDGLQIDDQIFHQSIQGQWNFVQSAVFKLMLASPDRRYYFVPTEGSGVIINGKDGSIFMIPSYRSKASDSYRRYSFVGNLFYEEDLIMVYRNQLVKVSLSDFNVQYGLWRGEGLIFDVEIGAEGLAFACYEVIERQRREYLIRMSDFEWIS